TEKQRNKLLADMTDEVAALVLRDNTFQTQSLAVSAALAPGLLESQERFIRSLERSGKLNRALEFLPSDEEIAERRATKRGLTAPKRRCCSPTARSRSMTNCSPPTSRMSLTSGPRSSATSRIRCAR